MQPRPLVTTSLGWWSASVMECKVSGLSLFLLDRCWYKHPDLSGTLSQDIRGGDSPDLPFPSLVWLLPCSLMAKFQVIRSFSYVGFSRRSGFAEGQNVPHWDVGCTECIPSPQSARCPRVCLVFNKVVQQTSNGACSLVLCCFQAGRSSFKK